MPATIAPMPDTSPREAGKPAIDLDSAAGFVRRLTHDVRNTLNALDLQLLLLESEDPSVKKAVAESRQMILSEARRLARISLQFQVPQPQWIEYSASDLFEDLQPRMLKKLGKSMMRVEWPTAVPHDEVRIDFEMVETLLGELLMNALLHGDAKVPVRVEAFSHDHAVMISIYEKLPELKSDPAGWGTKPFHSGSTGGYGLGLFCARRYADMLGIPVDFHFEAENGLLTTSLALPIVVA